LKIGNVRYRNRLFIAHKIRDEILLYSSLDGKGSSIMKQNSIGNLASDPELFESIKRDRISADFSLSNEEDLEFLPCVLRPEKIVGVGFNYHQHADETNTVIGGNPVLFSKYSDAAAGHMQKIKIPETVYNLDYEAEMAVVIGKHAFHVKEEEATDYIFGYCPANDLSARDLQFLTSQFLLGKTLPGFAPIGPYISTVDEIPDPQNLAISLTLNGETRQQSNTKNMIFNCNYLVSYITKYIPLNPGDIILTGTPGGVIIGYPPEKRVWIKHGDVTEVKIDKLGSLITEFA
jgi:2-keto-4-pentenoate hydratase/2-oxohepta-3-ene-1,7-dioic acid hydratase in catechol pathway